MTECYLSACKYHAGINKCYEYTCKNEQVILVEKLLQERFKQNRKSCLDFESVSCYNIISESGNAIENTPRLSK